MRINEIDIQTRIADILSEHGFNVVPTESQEGFKKPSVFVDVYPSEIALEGWMLEHVTDTVAIQYNPAVETTEDCAKAAQRIRNALMYKTFDISDRHFTIETLNIEIEDYILSVSFELDYYQNTPQNEDDEPMEILELGGNV